MDILETYKNDCYPRRDSSIAANNKFKMPKADGEMLSMGYLNDYVSLVIFLSQIYLR